MRGVAGTLKWYREHETTKQIGFDPDGRCLQIVRTARAIGQMYPSAISAQHATPAKYRITDLSKIRNGMVMYFDDPNDDNPFGHVVTVTAHEKVMRTLADITVRTNSVKANTIVPVKADYFGKHWGDKFQFAATWLNGQELTFPPKAPPKPSLTPLLHARNDLQSMVNIAKANKNDRLVTALTRDLVEINQTINQFK